MKHRYLILAGVLLTAILSSLTLSGCQSSGSSASEASKEVSKAVSEEASKEMTELEEIQVLSAYRDKVQKEDDKKVIDQEHNNQRELKVTYLDSVIRDVNEDGHYEMIVRYLAEGSGLSHYLVVLDEVVTIVDGQAVESGHYEYEEGFYDKGAAK